MSNLTIKEYKKAFVFEDNKNYTLAEKSYQIAVENEITLAQKSWELVFCTSFMDFLKKP